MKKIRRLIFFLVLFVVIAFGVQQVIFPLKYKGIIEEKADKYNIEPAIVFAMIKTESNFRPRVKSNKGAVGLMQVMPTTAVWITEKNHGKNVRYNLYDIEENIEVGCMYYSYLDQKYNGDKEKIWAAYNAGTSRIKDEKWREIKETRIYVKRVRRYEKIYKVILKIYS